MRSMIIRNIDGSLDFACRYEHAILIMELCSSSGGFLGMFFRRIVSQSLQLQNLFFTVMDLRRTSAMNEKESLIRDDFGLHKIIVVITKPGKLYGIDNLSGKIIWQVRVDNIRPFTTGISSAVMPLFVLRTARHSPLQPKCAVLAMESSTGNGVIVVFNPITGGLDDATERVVKLGFKVKQSMLSRHADEDFVKGIILLDEENKIHIYPPSSTKEIKSHASSTYIYDADQSGVLEGFHLTPDGHGGLVGSKIWQINLGLSGDKIVAIVGKNSQERVHSQGRVLGDRSVLYKYVNPNLVAVITQGYHPSCECTFHILSSSIVESFVMVNLLSAVLNLHLIDVVTGSIIHSTTHRRAKEPVHLVHSENWVIYTYFNEKYRRTELSALELYEGKTQSNATAFSSVDSTMLKPIVEGQAYILPANVLALKETITEKGITSKHILGSLSNYFNRRMFSKNLPYRGSYNLFAKFI